MSGQVVNSILFTEPMVNRLIRNLLVTCSNLCNGCDSLVARDRIRGLNADSLFLDMLKAERNGGVEMSEISLLSGERTAIDLQSGVDENGFLALSICSKDRGQMALLVTPDELVSLHKWLGKYLESR